MTLSALSIILAQEASGTPGGILGRPEIMFVLMAVMMYFLLIRPQQKQRKAHEQLVANVRVGDHVVLTGGEHGIITSVKDKTIMLKVADNVKIEYERGAIANVTKKSEVVEATPA